MSIRQHRQEAKELLGGRDYKPVKNKQATCVVLRPNGDIEVVYHNTPVVVYHKDGSCTLCTGGYMTYTTKARMNEFGPGQVFQKDFKWYWCPNAQGPDYCFQREITIAADSETVLFTDHRV